MKSCCVIGEYQLEKRRKERQNLFYWLMESVWHNDLQGTVRILVKDPTLVNYRQFTFYLPDKTNSILDYAKALNRETIIQVFLGFGAISGTSV
jgi:hypothetical protein